MGPMDLGIAPPAGSGRLKRDMGRGGAMGPGPKRMGAGPLDIGPAKGMGEAPNLRPAEDPAMSCGMCAHFDGQGMCQKFGNECGPGETCDGFEASGAGEGMESAAPGAPMMG